MCLTHEIIEAGLKEDDRLVLRHKSLTDKDIPFLCAYLHKHPNITTLDVRFNQIGDEGVKALAETNPLTRENNKPSGMERNPPTLYRLYLFAANPSNCSKIDKVSEF